MGRGRGAGGAVGALLLAGDDLVEVRLPAPVRVIGAPPPLEPLADYRGSVRRALRAPLELPPLRRLAGPGARVTVAFDDPCVLLPAPLRDPRPVVLEEVLDELTAAGVRDADVTLVCANGLHRRWRRGELLPLVGRRVTRRFGERLRCYDGEDPGANVSLGETPEGDLVEVDRAVVGADLMVYVGMPWTDMNGGHKSIACGLSTYRSIRRHHRGAVQAASPLMDPECSEMHASLRRIGRRVGAEVPVFQVETVVDNRVWAGPLGVLDLGRGSPAPGMRTARRLPAPARAAIRRTLRGAYRPAGVWAGAVEPVHRAALGLLAGNRVAVERQADIQVIGVPNMSPYAVHAGMNPLLVANLGLGYTYQFSRGRPLVRRGGTVVLATPCDPRFDRVHHPSYERFWREVLPVTRDAGRMEREHEPRFAADLDLVHAYRHGWAYHPAHPFFAWYWTERASRHVGRVIVAGGAGPDAPARMGFDWEPSVEAAVVRARSELGEDAEVAVQSVPPVFTLDVGA